MANEAFLQELLDNNDPTTTYAHKVLEGEIVAGPHVRAACKRHMMDLLEGQERGIFYSTKAANRAISFFPNVLRLADGIYAGEPFQLQLWQQFIIGSLFGWMGADGYRRFRTAYIEIGKGNGKSPLAAGIGLYGLCADGEAGAEIYAAATKLEQANILFRDAIRMVESSPHLSNRIVRHKNNLAYVSNHSFFRPISSEKRGLDGPRPHMGLIDEIHEHPDSIVVDKIRAGTKGRRQALIVEITNSGHDKTSVCWNHHEYSLRILAQYSPEGAAGKIEENDTWFAYVCALDNGDDWMKNEDCWIKANPNLGISITLKYLREQVAEAKGMPSKQSIVARLNFCEWVGAENPWISREMWESALGQFDLSECIGSEVAGAMDLSSRKDLTALALVWRLKDPLPHKPKVKYRAALWYWTPGDSVVEREKEDKVPYSTWEKQGHITFTPGNIVDYRWVAHTLGELQPTYDLNLLGYDPWRIILLQNELDDAGVEVALVPHAQGWSKHKSKETGDEEGLWMPKSIDELEGAILKGEIEILENPVLNWNSASAVLVSDPAGNRKFDKRKATGRIDGIVALAMAMGVATSDGNGGWSAYQFHDFLEIGG